MRQEKKYCGCVAIVGRPNVGKSTLLNNLLKKKVSITSHRANTTRHYTIGIHTKGPYQAIYIDTPGFRMKKKCAVNCIMRKAASDRIIDIKMAIFVVEGTRWISQDESVLNKLRSSKIPVILAVNKVDNIGKKISLLPHLQWLSGQMKYLDIVPISAETGLNVDIISEIVHKFLPEEPHLFQKEIITNHSHRFMVSEVIREKLMRFLGAELPYSTTVVIERFQSVGKRGYDISGLIFVKHKRQKKIVIGSQGKKINTIRIEACKDMQEIFQVPVHLTLWVKAKSPDKLTG